MRHTDRAALINTRRAALTSPIKLYHFFSSWGFPGGSESKESACKAGDLGSIPGSRRSIGEVKDNLLPYSCMDRGAWRAVVHGVAKSQT